MKHRDAQHQRHNDADDFRCFPFRGAIFIGVVITVVIPGFRIAVVILSAPIQPSWIDVDVVAALPDRHRDPTPVGVGAVHRGLHQGRVHDRLGHPPVEPLVDGSDLAGAHHGEQFGIDEHVDVVERTDWIVCNAADLDIGAAQGYLLARPGDPMPDVSWP